MAAINNPQCVCKRFCVTGCHLPGGCTGADFREGSGPLLSAQSKCNIIVQVQSQFAEMEGSVEARNQQTVGMIGIVCFEN